MDKVTDWILRHKIKAVIICVFIFFIPLIIVHILYKINIKYEWFHAAWSAGEIIAYVCTFYSLIGSLILGVTAVNQSKRANNLSLKIFELQKVTYLPMVFARKATIEFNECGSTRKIQTENYVNLENFCYCDVDTTPGQCMSIFLELFNDSDYPITSVEIICKNIKLPENKKKKKIETYIGNHQQKNICVSLGKALNSGTNNLIFELIFTNIFNNENTFVLKLDDALNPTKPLKYHYEILQA